MFDYFDGIKELLSIVEKEEKESIEQAVDCLVEAVENKQAIFAFGASHAGILTQELYYRAGGLMTVNPIFGNSILLDVEPVTHTSKMERLVGYGTLLADNTPFKEGDVLIVHSVSGRNPVSIELAMEAQKKGVTTIGLTNLTYSKTVDSRHPSGKNLYAFSDIVIDNHGDVGDSMCEIDGLDMRVGPSSTVVGATIVNTLVVETVKKLKVNGLDNPPIFYSANLDAGDELNEKLIKEYKDSIHYKF
ncbi:sugar isomerase domain-containing protein [Alkalibacterium olivapovliticus]|uniref:Putative phosphosugar-binding protein n=1 Tax=Alkalibacterium olivapovliticus TaxID=99907 RepID=A0A2T0W748_9LACT|nr:SIS domain-containing protein [Alkalibacterium olivapovliticus]PRY82509.1 putative phosphosugar-binding protein [Alkalibacterium olivapovliticus]